MSAADGQILLIDGVGVGRGVSVPDAVCEGGNLISAAAGGKSDVGRDTQTVGASGDVQEGCFASAAVVTTARRASRQRASRWALACLAIL